MSQAVKGVKGFRSTHGQAAGGRLTPIYRTWCAMRARCLSKTNAGYKYYGGRGITICERWLTSFENFRADMGPRPAGTSIDRINNDGNYEPSNCRWATQKQQANNQRRRGVSRYIDITGQRFGLLTAIQIDRRSPSSGMIWRCTCDCGNATVALTSQLRSKHVTSCGCAKKQGGGYPIAATRKAVSDGGISAPSLTLIARDDPPIALLAQSRGEQS